MKTSLIALLIAFLANGAPTGHHADITKPKKDKDAFVGSWLLDHVTLTSENGEEEEADVFSTGLIIYSADGYMSAVLTRSESQKENPGMDVGYCGRYEINEEETYVRHIRDVITINSENEEGVFVRDYEFSPDRNTLVLSPRESNRQGMSLTWKRASEK